MEPGPFEQYDILSSPTGGVQIEITEVNDEGWPEEGVIVRLKGGEVKLLLDDGGWDMWRQTGHDRYEEIDHDV